MYDQVMAVMSDTLTASQWLQDAGFDEEQAEALVSVVTEDIDSDLSTNGDVAVRTDLTQETAAVRVDLSWKQLRKLE